MVNDDKQDAWPTYLHVSYSPPCVNDINQITSVAERIPLSVNKTVERHLVPGLAKPSAFPRLRA